MGKQGVKTKTQSKRPRAESVSSRSSSGSGSGSEDGDDRAAMLAALEAHGRAMFGMQGPEQAESSAQGRRRMSGSEDSDEEEDDDDDDEDDDDDQDGRDGFQSDDGWGEGDEMVTDSEEEEIVPVKPALSKPVVPEVVFADTFKKTTTDTTLSNSERRAFLKGNSAKMMGIKQEAEYGPKSRKRQREESEGDLEDQSNLKLDKTLHDMLLTTLLPSNDAANASRPVDKRKAMSGRLLELAKYELPGEGTKSVAASGLTSVPAKIRTGIIHAQAKREKAARADAEAAGSFVRGLGGLGGEGKGYKAEKGRAKRASLGADTGKKKGMESRKGEARDRGLSMGIGKFQGGMLRLSERDIARGSGDRGGGGRGGRGGRGKGGKKGRGGW